jgi:hypothetical protein
MSGATSTAFTRLRTFGGMILEARTLLQDKIPTTGGQLRYSDDEMFESINRFMAEVRTKRPDLFLRTFGRTSLRWPTFPYYSASQDMGTPFPLDVSVYSAFVFYLVGMAELREDTFSDDSRAVTMANKAVSQLLQVQS